jgi:hypothetical protein
MFLFCTFIIIILFNKKKYIFFILYYCLVFCISNPIVNVLDGIPELCWESNDNKCCVLLRITSLFVLFFIYLFYLLYFIYFPNIIKLTLIGCSFSLFKIWFKNNGSVKQIYPPIALKTRFRVEYEIIL